MYSFLLVQSQVYDFFGENDHFYWISVIGGLIRTLGMNSAGRQVGLICTDINARFAETKHGELITRSPGLVPTVRLPRAPMR